MLVIYVSVVCKEDAYAHVYGDEGKGAIQRQTDDN